MEVKRKSIYFVKGDSKREDFEMMWRGVWDLCC